MEDVWNDLSLSSSSISFRSDHHALNFQDFLDPPLSTTKPTNDGLVPLTALSLGTGSSGSLPSPTPAKKRVFYAGDLNEEERHKRLMKNRESADRSRARKQAYTMELEKEVARLKKENSKLKGQLKVICSEGYAQGKHPKKHNLQRTLTAPF